MFVGHQSDYTFASSEDGLTVTVTDRSTGDVDTVTNVETLSFDDGDIAVSHDGTGLVLMGQSTDNIEVVGSVGVTVLGEAGNDTLTGGDGNDTIDGGEGDDTLTGGLGDDVIIASEGYDQIEGGAGTDTISFANDAIDAALNQLTTTNQFSNEAGVYVDLEQGTYDGPVDTTSSNGQFSGQLAGVENVGGSLFQIRYSGVMITTSCSATLVMMNYTAVSGTTC